MSETSPDETRPAIQTWWAEAMIDELVRCGLRHCCISPGSRSTPLVAAADAHDDLQTLSIIDERSSAFYALGLARATDRPVVLICTSGTAAANWMPTVCEADRAGVPLVLLTADRPPRLRDTGASQSMDQLKLFGDRVRWFHECERPEPREDAFRYLRSTIDIAWQEALPPSPGPVHLNCPFRKPLDPLPVSPDHRDAVPADFHPPEPSDETSPWSSVSVGAHTPDTSTIDKLVEQWRDAERPLLLCGADHRGARYRAALSRWAEATGTPVLAEPTSGLRFGDLSGPVIGTGDFLVDSNLYDVVGEPDLIVHTGEAPLNWAARAFVEQTSDVERISIQPHVQRRDPNHVVDHHVIADERRLFEAMLETSHGFEATDTWQKMHHCADRIARTALETGLLDADALEEPRLWWELQRGLPDPASIFVSNSMPIRNADLYMPGREEALDVYFNRGLNGIDGIESTGAGVARGTTSPTVVVAGDVAFRHDVSGLATARRTETDVTYVVVDNGGGAIFDKLPISECGSVHERHFVAEPDLRPSEIAEGFGLEAHVPEHWSDVRESLEASVGARSVDVLVVRTDRRRDDRRADAIRAQVVEAIDRKIAEDAR